MSGLLRFCAEEVVDSRELRVPRREYPVPSFLAAWRPPSFCTGRIKVIIVGQEMVICVGQWL